MPVVPPATLTDITKVAQRNQLQRDLYEREVMGYGFSYAALLKLAKGDVAAVQKCIVAYNDDEAKEVKAQLNDKISGIMSEYNITSMKSQDPFGREKDCLFYPSTSSSFSQARAISKAAKYGIKPDALQKLFADADVTIKKEITIVTVKDSRKEGEPANAKGEKA